MGKAYPKGSSVIEASRPYHQCAFRPRFKPCSGNLGLLLVLLFLNSNIFTYIPVQTESIFAGTTDQNNIAVSYLNSTRRASESPASFLFRQLIITQIIESKGKTMNNQAIDFAFELTAALKLQALNVLLLPPNNERFDLIDSVKQSIRNEEIYSIGKERTGFTNQNILIIGIAVIYGFSRRVWARLGIIANTFASKPYRGCIYGLTRIFNPIYTQEHRTMRYFCAWIT